MAQNWVQQWEEGDPELRADDLELVNLGLGLVKWCDEQPLSERVGRAREWAERFVVAARDRRGLDWRDAHGAKLRHAFVVAGFEALGTDPALSGDELAEVAAGLFEARK